MSVPVSTRIIVDALRPVPPPPGLTLIGAPATDASAPSDPHWTAGVDQVGYPTLDGMGTWWLCEPHVEIQLRGLAGSSGVKVPTTLPDIEPFDSFTIYLGLECGTQGLTLDDLDQRVQAAYQAYEHYTLEAQVWAGDISLAIPYLADDNATILASGAAQTVVEGFALLETAIAETGRAGVIHCTVALATAAAGDRGLLRWVNGHLETYLGTVVIPGQGYSGAGPSGEASASPSGTDEWAYATTPFMVRRGNVFVPPNQFGVDRANNVATVWAERDYVYAWDQTLQAAVQINRAT